MESEARRQWQRPLLRLSSMRVNLHVCIERGMVARGTCMAHEMQWEVVLEVATGDAVRVAFVL